MLSLNADSKIILFPKPVNLHKSFDSLSHLVSTELNIALEPNLFILFSNIRKNRIKILHHDGHRLVLFYMRFDRALYFSYQEGTIFNQMSFDNFLNIPNPRWRLNQIKHP